jgi:hypothetical protein
MLKLGISEINKGYLGGTEINKAYLGLDVVFEASVFTSLWETTTPNETITLPTTTNYVVNWGDGTTTNNTNSHQYTTAGQYTVKINGGNITDFSFNNTGDSLKIKQVLEWGKLELIPGSFYGCRNLEVSSILDIPKTLIDIRDSFRDCRVLTWNNLINGLDLQNVGNIDRMFTNCFVFNQNINNWDVSSLNTLIQVFNNCKIFNQPLNNWEVGNVTDFTNLFRGALVFNQDISSWDIGRAENLQNMFNNAQDFNQTLDEWDFSNVTNMSGFMSSKSTYDIDYMDDLYIKLDQDLLFSNMANVNISFGSIQYSINGATARASLVSKGFIITSGGQV